MKTSDEAVEAGAKALLDYNYGVDDWELVTTEKVRSRYLEEARAVLVAAAPHMLSEAWDEGSRAGWSDRTRSLMERRTYDEEIAKATPNPYRSQT